MTSVPKPLKFLRPHYDTLKAALEGLPAGAPNREALAGVVRRVCARHPLACIPVRFASRYIILWVVWQHRFAHKRMVGKGWSQPRGARRHGSVHACVLVYCPRAHSWVGWCAVVVARACGWLREVCCSARGTLRGEGARDCTGSHLRCASLRRPPAAPPQVSVLAMTSAEEGSRETLKYKLQAAPVDVAKWGHEYIRHLAGVWMGCMFTARGRRTGSRAGGRSALRRAAARACGWLHCPGVQSLLLPARLSPTRPPPHLPACCRRNRRGVRGAAGGGGACGRPDGAGGADCAVQHVAQRRWVGGRVGAGWRRPRGDRWGVIRNMTRNSTHLGAGWALPPPPPPPPFCIKARRLTCCWRLPFSFPSFFLLRQPP